MTISESVKLSNNGNSDAYFTWNMNE